MHRCATRGCVCLYMWTRVCVCACARGRPAPYCGRGWCAGAPGSGVQQSSLHPSGAVHACSIPACLQPHQFAKLTAQSWSTRSASKRAAPIRQSSPSSLAAKEATFCLPLQMLRRWVEGLRALQRWGANDGDAWGDAQRCITSA